MKSLFISFHIVGLLALVAALNSCSGSSTDVQALTAERDSLAQAAQEANSRYDELTVFISDISECIDSVSMQENLALMSSDPETGRKYSRKEIRERIQSLGSLIDRQRQRITSLMDSLSANNLNVKEVERLTNLVSYLNQQLDAKEAQLQKLQGELANSKRSIAELQSSVAMATAANEQLTNENNSLDQLVVEKSQQLQQGWFMAKTKKDLQEMGILSGGNLLKKAKFVPGAVNTSDCAPVDITTFTEVSLNSKKKPVLLSQSPASSYMFEEITKGQWRLTITDTMAFWSLSKIVVIQLQ